MTLLQSIRYRWQNCCKPLPGEVDPYYQDGQQVFVTMISTCAEHERFILLRRLRAVLFGYGPGWTFCAAAWDWFLSRPFPYLIGALGLWLIVRSW